MAIVCGERVIGRPYVSEAAGRLGLEWRWCLELSVEIRNTLYCVDVSGTEAKHLIIVSARAPGHDSDQACIWELGRARLVERYGLVFAHAVAEVGPEDARRGEPDYLSWVATFLEFISEFRRVWISDLLMPHLRPSLEWWLQGVEASAREKFATLELSSGEDSSDVDNFAIARMACAAAIVNRHQLPSVGLSRIIQAYEAQGYEMTTGQTVAEVYNAARELYDNLPPLTTDERANQTLVERTINQCLKRIYGSSVWVEAEAPADGFMVWRYHAER